MRTIKTVTLAIIGLALIAAIWLFANQLTRSVEKSPRDEAKHLQAQSLPTTSTSGPETPNRMKQNTDVKKSNAFNVIKGRVIDSSRNPLANALVEVISPAPGSQNTTLFSTRSDENGGFILKKDFGEEFDVIVSLSGFLEKTAKIQTMDRQTVEIVLIRKSGLAVDVIAGDGPIRGAKVSISGRHLPYILNQLTGEEGRAQFRDLSPAAYTVRYEGSDAARLSKTITLPEGEIVEVVLAVPSGDASIYGRVLNNGEPVAGAVVLALLDTANGELVEIRRKAVSDELGLFELNSMCQGQWTISARKDLDTGELQRILYAPLTSGQALQKDIDLAAGASLIGRVSGMRLDEEFAALLFRGVITLSKHPSVEEIETINEYGGTVAETSVSPESGEFTLQGLEAGVYTLIVYAYSSNGNSEASTTRLQAIAKRITIGNDQEVQSIELDLPPSE